MIMRNSVAKRLAYNSQTQPFSMKFRRMENPILFSGVCPDNSTSCTSFISQKKKFLRKKNITAKPLIYHKIVRYFR